MHWSLDPRKKLALVPLWLLPAALLAWLASPFPMAQIVIGILAGALAGAFQRRALEEEPGLFREAATGLQVRRALGSTRGGRRVVGLQWVAGFAMLGVGQFSRHAGASRLGTAYGLACGLLVMMALHDLTVVPALRRLWGERG